MSYSEAILLITVGTFAGFINTVSGGGSLITFPLLMFMGLPPIQANASNRIAIFIQNISAVQGFRSKGIFLFPFSLWLSCSATFGAFIGAKLAVDIDPALFNKILAVIMLMVMAITILKPYIVDHKTRDDFSRKRLTISIFIFFFIGIYGGFIQAGIGFLMIAALTYVHGISIAKTNSVKVFVVLCYTSIALLVFIMDGVVRWEYGLILALGNALGGWIASRWSVDKDDKVLRWILIISVFGLAIKLWFLNPAL